MKCASRWLDKNRAFTLIIIIIIIIHEKKLFYAS